MPNKQAVPFVRNLISMGDFKTSIERVETFQGTADGVDHWSGQWFRGATVQEYELWLKGGEVARSRQAAKVGDGTQVGIFIPLPSELAEQFPALKEDSSPSHVTVLYVGAVEKDREAEFMEIATRHFQDGLKAPISGKLDGLDFFSGPGGKVQHVKSRYSQDIALVRWRLMEELREKGFKLQEHSQTVWRPHTTLAYDSDEWEGVVPKGSWDFDSFEVWGLSSVKKITLDEPSTRKAGQDVKAGPDDYEAQIHGEAAAQVWKQNPKKGWFANLNGWYGDVWAEVKHVYPPSDTSPHGSMVVYLRRRGARIDTEYVFAYNVRKVSRSLPNGARIVHTKDESYGGRNMPPLSEMPR